MIRFRPPLFWSDQNYWFPLPSSSLLLVVVETSVCCASSSAVWVWTSVAWARVPYAWISSTSLIFLLINFQISGLQPAEWALLQFCQTSRCTIVHGINSIWEASDLLHTWKPQAQSKCSECRVSQTCHTCSTVCVLAYISRTCLTRNMTLCSMSWN